MYCISRRQYQRFFGDVSVAHLVASVSSVVPDGVVMVEGSSLARGKCLQHLSAQLIHYTPLYLFTV